MSDLVKRLRGHDEYEPLGHVGWEAADRIEQLERELAKWRVNYGELGLNLAAEKALADRLATCLDYVGDNRWNDDCEHALAAYRKARGL